MAVGDTQVPRIELQWVCTTWIWDRSHFEEYESIQFPNVREKLPVLILIRRKCAHRLIAK